MPDPARKRLQFIHVIWLVLTGGLGVAALIGGAADSVLLAGLVLAALPGVVGAPLLHPGVQSEDLAGPFLVIGWTLLAMLGIASTGAALSPLTILFAIAPLTAITLGKPGMAAEAAIFGAFAFLAAAIMVLGSAIGPGITGLALDLGVGIETQFVFIAVYFAFASGMMMLGVARARPALSLPL